MRYYPDMDDEYDRTEVEEIGAKRWMLDALRFNPSYMGWGPHEDYMAQRPGEDHGWRSNVFVDDWPSFKWEPDDLNIIANFYFHIDRESRPCEACGGTGLSPDAQWVFNSWYRHKSPFYQQNLDDVRVSLFMEHICGGVSAEGTVKAGQATASQTAPGTSSGNYDDPGLRAMVEKYGEPFREHVASAVQNGGEWSAALTQDEADALWEGKRLGLQFTEKPTAEQVNLMAKSGPMFHDGINMSICCNQRCKRLGIPVPCTKCKGHSYVYTVPEPRLELVLWVLHPRKGCGRAVVVKSIKEEEVRLAMAFLKKCYASFTRDVWKRALAWPRLPKPKARKKRANGKGKGKGKGKGEGKGKGKGRPGTEEKGSAKAA